MLKLIVMMSIFSLTAYASPQKSLYDLSAEDLGGKTVKMSEFKDKALLFVNTASSCGYTPQLSDLEKLYKKYKSEGLIILGFPSNDFNQEGLSGVEIKKFCKLNYGVTFPLFKKTSVTGDNKNSVYNYLLSQLDNQRVGWNFEKILVSKEGKVLKKFKSAEAPLGGELEKLIVENLVPESKKEQTSI